MHNWSVCWNIVLFWKSKPFFLFSNSVNKTEAPVKLKYENQLHYRLQPQEAQLVKHRLADMQPKLLLFFYSVLGKLKIESVIGENTSHSFINWNQLFRVGFLFLTEQHLLRVSLQGGGGEGSWEWHTNSHRQRTSHSCSIQTIQNGKQNVGTIWFIWSEKTEEKFNEQVWKTRFHFVPLTHIERKKTSS